MVGKRVVEVGIDSDGVGLLLDGGWSIAIWVGYEFRINGEIQDDERMSEIKGAVLIMFVGDSDVERLIFDNGCELLVNLLDGRGCHSELMAVYGPNKVTVVWN